MQDLKGNFAASEEQLATLFAEDVARAKDELSMQLFGKAHSLLTKQDLHGLTNQLLSGLYMFRRNCPFNLPDLIALVFEHPRTDFLDKNSLLVGLEMFDFDLEAMNADKLLVERPVVISEMVESERRGKEEGCFEHFYGKASN